MPIKNNSKQLFNGLLITIGAIFLVYALVKVDTHIYVKVIGLVLLMLGAYRASRHWVGHKDDHLNDDQNMDNEWI